MADNEEKTGNRGDKSGRGRERRDDQRFPQGRDADQMGTHGGPKRHGSEEQRPEKKEP